MAWYRTGTVTVTNNSNVITGTGTAWMDAVSIGETFLGPDSQVYEITSIVSGTSLRVSPNYKGPTAANQSYAVMPTQSYIRDLAAQAAELVNSYATVRDTAGKGKFAAGTAAAPSLRATADEDTGVNLPGSNVLEFITGGTVRATLNSAGVMNFSVSPTAPTPAAGANNTAIQTTAGSLLQMKQYGLGQERFGEVASGYPKVLPSSIGNGSPTTFITAEAADSQASGNAPVSGEAFSGVSVSRGLRPVQLGVSGAGAGASAWYRGYSTAGPVLADWKRLADLNSPAFTGAPSAPNLRLTNSLSSNANTLDYYEEGAFTPTLVGTTAAGTNTYAINAGRYTRIGGVVFWTAVIELSSTSGMTGQLRLNGLPFSVANARVARGAVTIGYYSNLSDTAAYDFRAFHNVAAATVDFLKRAVGVTTSGAFPASEVGNTSQIYLSGHYEV
ncbi:hypothetical protein QYQ99_27055 [Comamonas testosteroni]|uniref:hypothetical protein n=1 Tax=Comamonas testosteroni TaxID=285 RepID=UPI0026605AB5|nr:hypothetical protein [Comamonas testosteroni]WKL15925.1 hypothetical protein QYQ99_27055 [Comamonas testosteroni]